MNSREHNNKFVSSLNSIWEQTEGGEFEKALALFCSYACFGETFGFLSMNITHKEAVTKVLEAYYGENGYLIKSPNTVVCNIGFLLLKITDMIKKDSINPEGKLAAIFEVIQDKTGINVYALYEPGDQENKKLILYYEKSWAENRFKLIEYKSFSLFMIGTQLFSSFKNSHPVNAKSISLFIENKLDSASLQESIQEEIKNKHDVISLMLRCDLPLDLDSQVLSHEFLEYISNNDRFNSYDNNLLKEQLANFFKKSLECRQYRLALYFFKKAIVYGNLFNAYSDKERQADLYCLKGEDVNWLIDELYNMSYSEEFKRPRGWDAAFAFKIVSLDETHGRLSMKSIYELFRLFSYNESEFSLIKKKILEKQDIDFDQILFFAIKSKNETLTHLLLSSEKSINLKKAFIICRKNINASGNLNIEDHRDYETYGNDCVRITLPQFAITSVTGSKYEASCSILKQLAEYDSQAFSEPDSMGTSIFYYSRPKSHYFQQPIAILNKICHANNIEKILFFILIKNARQGILSDIPDDVLRLIISLTAAVLSQDQEDLVPEKEKQLKCEYEQHLKSRKSLKHDGSYLGVSLTQDQAVEIFCKELAECRAYITEEFCPAFHVLFAANQISELNHNQHPCDVDRLSVLAGMLDRPIQAIYILKFMEHLQRYGHKIHTASYLKLFNKKDLISDWECVSNKFFRLFTLNSNGCMIEAVNCSDHQAFNYLLERKQAEIRLENKQITPLQAIIMDKLSIYRLLYDPVPIIQYISKHKPHLLLERDGDGNDLQFYLNQLKEQHPSHHDEINAMINMVKKEMCFARTGLLFFGRKSPSLPELPAKLVEEIVRLSMDLSM